MKRNYPFINIHYRGREHEIFTQSFHKNKPKPVRTVEAINISTCLVFTNTSFLVDYGPRYDRTQWTEPINTKIFASRLLLRLLFH